MRLPHPDTVDAVDLAKNLRLLADHMILTDGDRDHMNTSRLTCENVRNAFRLMLMAADKLAPPRS